jgi:hypothetical protein
LPVCAAYPATVLPGESSQVICSCETVSSWGASAGTVSGTGATAVYSSYGAPSGVVTIQANCPSLKPSVQKVLIAVGAVPAPAAPRVASLCSISFDGADKSRPTRVDNEARACLDDVALVLSRQSDASLTLVGADAAPGAAGAKVAGQRAINVKDYLVTEKGIDASRIKTFSDETKAKQVRMFLVPEGANPDLAALTPTEDQTKAQARKPFAAKKKKQTNQQ